MLIDPRDPAKQQRDYINEKELEEIKRITKLCESEHAPAEILTLMLKRNEDAFEVHREEFRKRGIMV